MQHALDLAIRLLVAPGQPVLVESPTYPNALATLAARRARVLTYGLDGSGWDADLLLATPAPEPAAPGLPGTGVPEPDRRA